jgi:hypothetical protein
MGMENSDFKPRSKHPENPAEPQMNTQFGFHSAGEVYTEIIGRLPVTEVYRPFFFSQTRPASGTLEVFASRPFLFEPRLTASFLFAPHPP